MIHDENDTQAVPQDDLEYQCSWSLLQVLRERKLDDPEHGRLWAMAVSDAEKLHAWITYVLATIEDEGASVEIDDFGDGYRFTVTNHIDGGELSGLSVG